MKKTILLILILITIKSYSQDSSFGKPNFKIFWNYHNDFTEEVTKKSAFELKRVYLGYKYNFNDKYKPIGKHIDKYYQYYFKNMNDLNKITFIKENIMINTSLL